MIYIDTSSLLKLLITDEHSIAVEEATAVEVIVVVSSLAELEANIQIRGLSRSGNLRPGQLNRVVEDLMEILSNNPFTCRKLKGTVFTYAIRQHQESTVHCRSLDRLHLAAMEELGVRRLMTHDGRQAEAARELGYEVVMPGVG